ncbi:flagellar hook-associated protein FlgK [Paenisporosarcina quisquiliarum]|uniref:Flagellar hook-associated protein 1 n=1 Tax=Paenisporosarcina quisquiliarum TaxID=365346 RepID=A0A9X3LGC5_9BACL|nr:flagellar hook-associated protein FlgK [Paenisporosarcina quisquiliarum]MCZ8536920.1 flagellar hook-associated protein FlgK [Paenisporosarcina quisquiliarum]
MVSTFHGLEVGKRGLMVGQASISTTGHNIANANTKGYSRQQVNAITSPSLDVWTSGAVNPGQLGTGVLMESITRVRDHFLDQQYRNQSGTLGEWSIRQETLDQLETVINEPSDTGLRTAMDQLAGAFQDLANEPDSLSAKAVVKERAQAFIETIQSMDRSMTEMKKDLNQQQTVKMNEANGYLEQIAQLNDSIKRTGSQANDLQDKRDVLIEELSKLVSIKVDNQADGTSNISLTDGTSLVEGASIKSKIDATSTFGGGELSGIVKSLVIVDDYQTKLNAVAKDFVEANQMSSPTDASQPGENLFSGDADYSIASLKVNPNVENDMKQITPLFTGMEEKSKAVNSSYRSLVSELGTESQTAIRQVANYEATLQATDSRRQSVTGVSLDEEMANLIKYQHSYSAAARMVSTTDQMLDTIINRMAAR